MDDYKTEVEKLKNEILKLKADKDFVWSLWKRLQLSSPDLTEAVNLISQREKEKLLKEHNDFKRLSEDMDDKLRSLKNLINAKNVEIETLTKRNHEIVKRSEKLENQCADLAEKASKLDDLMSNIEANEQRQIISDYEHERHKLSESISQLQAKITVLTDEKAKLHFQLVQREDNEMSMEDLRHQLDQATDHIGTQQETIRLLREQLEQSIKQCRHAVVSEDGYSSDRTVEYHHNDMNDNSRPVSPIVDLNYKVDRLSVHMQHLQECMNRPSLSNRSRSMPPRKADGKRALQLGEMGRKIQFLTQKLARTEQMLTEEKKVSTSSGEFLDKANKRIKSSQLTIKQLRQQLDDGHQREMEWKASAHQLELDMALMRKEIETREAEMHRMKQNSVTDAARIQDLLSKLENLRDDLTEKNVRQAEQSTGEIEGLKQLVQQLEREKYTLEMSSGLAGIEQGTCVCSINTTARARPVCPRTRKSKINCNNGHIKSRNKKIRNMGAILNHFTDNNSTSLNKDDDWEDIDTESASEEEITATESTALSTERNDPSSNEPSMGALVARLASINQCCDRGDQTKLAQRKTSAKQNHVTRISSKPNQKTPIQQEMVVAKNRIASLEQQLKSVASSRDEIRSQMKTIQTQMDGVNEDLAQSRSRCSRLVEAIKKQSARYRILIEERNQLLGKSDKDFGLDADDVDSALQPYLSELSSTGTICRELQHELAKRDGDLLQLRDKLSRAERENAGKKKIIDDLKKKMHSVDAIKDREKKTNEMKDRRIKDLEDSNSKMKTQLDSLHTRFNVVLDERRRFEGECASLMTKLDGNEMKLAELRQIKSHMETRLGKIDEDHQKQISSVISRSGSALDKAGLQIQDLKARGGKCETLVYNLAKDFYQKIREIRRLIEFGQRKFNSIEATATISNNCSAINSPRSAFEFARNKAADILSLSTSDIDYLLNGGSQDQSTRDWHRRNQANNSAAVANGDEDDLAEFPQKCKRAFRNPDFDEHIQALFAERLEQIMELVVPTSSDSGCGSFS